MSQGVLQQDVHGGMPQGMMGQQGMPGQVGPPRARVWRGVQPLLRTSWMRSLALACVGVSFQWERVRGSEGRRCEEGASCVFV